MAGDVTYDMSRGTTIKIRPTKHQAFALTVAGATGTPANSLLISGREGFKLILFHIGFSNSDASSNNIAMHFVDSGEAPVDPDVDMTSMFLRETLLSGGVSLRNLIGMEIQSEPNQDLHGWLDANSDGWFVNLGYAYIKVPA